MIPQTLAHMTAEEVLAQHERDRAAEEHRRVIQVEREQMYAERDAKLAAMREAERIAKSPPPDPRDVAADQIVALLGDRFMPVMAAFAGSGDDAPLVLRRLQKEHLRRRQVAAKPARISARQAELDAGAL